MTTIGVQPEDEERLAEDRHRKEVRELLRMARSRGRQCVQEYLNSPAVIGRREALRVDLNAQRRAGNDGDGNKWL